MFLQEMEFDGRETVSEIVQRDYRTADVFAKYDIEYCCGGKWPLSTICMMKGVEEKLLVEELKKATRTIQLSSSLSFEKWSIDFLIDYIINVHHSYLKKMLPDLEILLTDFVADHSKKYAYLDILQSDFNQFQSICIPHLKHEEDVIFPYLRQVSHAYEDKNSYGAQLVRTLRKPIDKMIEQEHEVFSNNILKFRKITGNYTPPEKACTNHKVILSKLKELDNDVVQHIYLENDVLFPKVISMEKELLGKD